MNNLLIISFLASIALLSNYSQAELCNPQDKKALLQIKLAFGNPYLLASWKNDTDCCTDWYQVECDSTTNRITSLTVFSGNLSGQLPPAIGDLPYLQMLDFNHLSDVTGPIQPTISKLTKLTFLRLKNLALTGSVPAFLGQLTGLTFLDLSHNKLSGEIPAELSSLSNLQALHLDNNQLTGAIPASLGNFKGNPSPDIYLSNNKLTGHIPASFATLKLTSIDLSRNSLVGDASMLFGSSQTTQIIDISRNTLAFDFSKVVFPSSLTSLDMNHNDIYGSLPTQLTQLNLQLLNVSYNSLCGQIPVGGKLQSFETYDYLHNKCLCGSPLASCK